MYRTTALRHDIRKFYGTEWGKGNVCCGNQLRLPWWWRLIVVWWMTGNMSSGNDDVSDDNGDNGRDKSDDGGSGGDERCWASRDERVSEWQLQYSGGCDDNDDGHASWWCCSEDVRKTPLYRWRKEEMSGRWGFDKKKKCDEKKRDKKVVWQRNAY